MMEEKKKKSPYDEYMDEATNLYNQQKQQSLDQASNQSALAHSQYQEVNRNLNEINKAKGLNNTGYEGDTQVNAYNAYRNAVNSANLNAQTTNNQLYSYYLQEMANLQNAKFNQETTERQLQMQEDQNNYNKLYGDYGVLNRLEVAKGENAYDENGNIKEDSAKRMWEYVTTIYGDDIPNEVIAELNNEKGFDKWVDVYNQSYKTTGNNNIQNNQTVTQPIVQPIVQPTVQSTVQTNSNNKDIPYTQDSFANDGVEWEIKGLGSGRSNDSIDFFIDGKKYSLKTGGGVSKEKAKELNVLATGRETDPNYKGETVRNNTKVEEQYWDAGNFFGATANYKDTAGRLVIDNNGNMYLYTQYGWRLVESEGDSVHTAVEKYLSVKGK